MLLVDERREVVSVNDAALRLLGRSRRGVLGARLWSFVADGPVASEAEWAAWLAAGRFSGEVDLLRPDGTPVAVQWGATTVTVTRRGSCCSCAWGPPAGAAASAARSRPTSPTTS